MYYLILNGNPQASAFDDYLAELERALSCEGHQTRQLLLRDMNLNFCTGCWSCWWKTPGLCAHQDDIVQIYPEVVRADLVFWSSPLILGTVSSLLKKVQDRFVALIHPYVELVDGECHHRYRYAHNPDLGLIMGPQADDSDADIEITRTLFERFSKNTRTQLRVCATTTTPIQEVLHAATVA